MIFQTRSRLHTQFYRPKHPIFPSTNNFLIDR
ncbi:MAG: hypothetical protein ACLUG7_00620 [Lachnospiraceae bacterium]